MADDQVKYSELIKNDNQSFAGLIEALNNVKTKLAELKQEGVNYRISLKGANTVTKEQQQDMAQDAAAVERTRSEIKRLTDEEARLKAAIAEANRMTKLQGQAANAVEGSLNQMRARYKLLVAEMGNYNLRTEEGRRKMQSTAAQARKLRDEIYKLESAYGQFGRNVGNYSGSLSRFGAGLKEAGARFVAFNAAFLSFSGLIRFGRALYETRKELESSLVTFKALAGEVQGAKLFEQIKEFAFTTPVTLNAAAKATQTMLSFGVAQDKVVDIMQRLGDISAGDSDRLQRLALAYSQATQAGRLMGQDTLQFINSGFNPLYYISLRTGKSMMELRKEMQAAKIPIEMVTQAIIDATSEGGQFNGMLDKQKETMKGAANIMSGAWQNMLNEMGEEMQGSIVGVLKWLTNMMKNWRETITILREVAVSVGVAKAGMLLYKVAVEAGTKAVRSETMALGANSAAATANATATATATKAQWGWATAWSSVKTAINGVGVALKSFLPFAVIAGVTMLVQKLIDANREMNRLTDYTKEFAEVETDMNREMNKEIRKLDQLFNELLKTKRGTEDYKIAQQNIIDNFGKYNETLSTELNSVTNLKTAYDNLTKSIQNNYKQKARQAFMDKSETKLAGTESKLREELNEFVEKYTDSNGNWKNKELTLEGTGKGTAKRIYQNISNYLQYGEWLDHYVATAIINGRIGLFNKDLSNAARNYQIAGMANVVANQRADALWGPYVEPTETSGFTPITTGDGDSGSGKAGKGPSEKSITDKYWEAIRARLKIEQDGYKLEMSLLKVDRDEKLANLEEWQKEQHAALKENYKNGFITEKEYKKEIAEIDQQYSDIRKGIEDDYWKAVRALRSKNMKEMGSEWEKNAKENAKAELKAMADGWQEQRAKLVEQGASRRKLIDAEVTAEIARLNMMLELNRTVNGEIMSDEEKAKVKEWIVLLEKIQKTGKYNNIKPGQIAGKGAANVNTDRSNYTSATQMVADVLGVDVSSEQISALNSVFDQAKAALNSWMDARKAAADQAKELADVEVSSAEQALNREIELRNQGYANDVALREKELADAKAQQKKALEQQEKAKKEELAINTALEASNMAVAVANLFKQFGLYAIPMAAVMLGAWAATKISAFQQINSAKYREGGVMLLEGGSHQSGHDVNLGIGPDGSNLRAEGGEYFAVINKRNSRKYGGEIPAVVNALNSGMFENKYIKTSDAVGMMGNVGLMGNVGEAVDLSAVESGVEELVKQGESRWTVEGEWRVERYKNRVRRVKIG